MPWVSLEEAEVIEEASRRVGKEPAQFIKDAGLAIALAVLDAQAGKGRGLRCDPLKTSTHRRKYCVSGVANIHRKYCVDGFR